MTQMYLPVAPVLYDQQKPWHTIFDARRHFNPCVNHNVGTRSPPSLNFLIGRKERPPDRDHCNNHVFRSPIGRQSHAGVPSNLTVENEMTIRAESHKVASLGAVAQRSRLLFALGSELHERRPI